MAEKTLEPVDRDVEVLKVYPVGDTDVCIAMRDFEDRKCIDQYYNWDAVIRSVIPTLEEGIKAGEELEKKPVPPGEKKPKPVITITVINPKGEPDERCHLRIKDASKVLSRLRELVAARPSAA